MVRPPNFKGSPHCIAVRMALMGPQTADVVEGIGGDGTPVTASISDFGRSVHAIHTDGNGNGLYAVRSGKDPVRFIVDFEDGIVHLEGGDRPIPVGEFVDGAARSDAAGAYITSFALPLHAQRQACLEHGEADDHLLDISQWAGAYRESERTSRVADAGFYDIIVSGLDDGISYIEAMRRAMSRPVRPIHAASGLDRCVPGPWHLLTQTREYMQPAVRQLFKGFMEDLLGRTPMEAVSRVNFPPGTPVAHVLGPHAEFVGNRPPFEAPNIIPGYRTSPVSVFRREGADIIVFSDFQGVYAYAWPRELRPEAGPGQDDRPDPFRRGV